jgi:CRISPR-associated endonuclease/helicase Cas3
MIDVAAVVMLMWEEVLPQAVKKRLACALGLPTDKVGLEFAGKMVAWIAGLHDLGKASPPFALRETAQNLKRIYDGTGFSEQYLRHRKAPPPQEAPHGYVTASELPDILTSKFGFPGNLAERIAALIGGHHGIFPRSRQLLTISDSENYRGGAVWQSARRELAVELAGLLGVPCPVTLLQSASFDNATTMILAGLVSVADWIGSNSTYFECEVKDSQQPIDISAQNYLAKARSNAGKALAELGWLDWPAQDQSRTFAVLFPKLSKYPPRDLQTTAIDLAVQLSTPGLVVIEAPMGEGKTEAAMYLADYWNVRLDQRGCYFALPTQATSNQMFSRVREFLEERFVGRNVLLQLLHGHAALSAEFETNLKKGATLLQLTPVYDETGDAHQHHHDDCTPGVVAAEWFTHRKRGLLAPFGVGTVDQALMAVLQTKHVFVRLFGLAHKTIIIDEVHAYDAYMSVLLERLLEWLAALGSPVILLSATLPKQRRDALRDAYLKGLGAVASDGNTVTATPNPEDCYPRITWATAQSQGVKHIKPFFPGEADDGWLELDLLHARFLFKDRAEREIRALIRFGKNKSEVIDREGFMHKVRRPQRAVLVSTQIIEQSLDLDFDLMVTDLAPVDLILQRAGRLHRHQRESQERPANLQQPMLWIMQPELGDDGLPDFGVNGFVYDPHILLRSWLEMRDCEQIMVPDNVESLIEAVYDLQRVCPYPAFETMWQETKDKLEKKLLNKEARAKAARILYPDAEQLLQDFNRQLEEDRPDVHKSLQALTRDDELPSVSVIFLTPEEAQRNRHARKPDLQATRFLLERSASVNRRGAVDALLKRAVPTTWQDSPLLRHHRLVDLDASGQQQIGGYQFIVHPELGIIINKLIEGKV